MPDRPVTHVLYWYTFEARRSSHDADRRVRCKFEPGTQPATYSGLSVPMPARHMPLLTQTISERELDHWELSEQRLLCVERPALEIERAVELCALPREVLHALGPRLLGCQTGAHDGESGA